MGFRINTNISSMNAHRNSFQTNLGLDKSLGALSSGLRINRASDDASGMAIADSFRQQAQGLGQAIMNANDGIGLVQTADSALDEYVKIAETIRTKAVQAASDGQTSETRKSIQQEIDKLMQEAQNISSSVSFNGVTLLNGGFQNKSFHIGSYSGETVKISIDDARTTEVGKFALAESTTGLTATTGQSGASTVSLSVSVTNADGTTSTSTGSVALTSGAHTSAEIAQMVADSFNADASADGTNARASVYELSSSTAGTAAYGIRVDSSADSFTTTEAGFTIGDATAGLTNNFSTIDVTTKSNAEKAIIISDYSLKDIDSVRSNIGSVQSQLESTIRNISVTHVNVQAAESNIRDVDFAAESVHFAKLNILAQSGSYSLSQANTAQQSILRLLQ